MNGAHVFLIGIISLFYVTQLTDAKIRRKLVAPSGEINYPPKTIVFEETPKFIRRFINGRYAIWYKEVNPSSTITMSITNMKIGANILKIQGSKTFNGHWENVGPSLTGSRGMYRASFNRRYKFIRIILKRRIGSFKLSYTEDLCGPPTTATLKHTTCTNGFVAGSYCNMTCIDPTFVISPDIEQYTMACNEQTRQWHKIGNVAQKCVLGSKQRNFNNSRGGLILTQAILNELDGHIGTVSFPLTQINNDKADPFYLLDAASPYVIWYKHFSEFSAFDVEFSDIDLENNTMRIEGSQMRGDQWTPLHEPISGKIKSQRIEFEGYPYFRIVLQNASGSFKLRYAEVYCPDMGNATTVMANCTNGFLLNSVCSMKCRDEKLYKLQNSSTHQCLLHGAWSTTGVTICEPNEEIAQECFINDECGYTAEQLLAIFEPTTVEEPTEKEDFDLFEFDFREVYNGTVPDSILNEIGMLAEPVFVTDRGLELDGKPHVCTAFCKFSVSDSAYRPQCNLYQHPNPEIETALKKLCLYCRSTNLCKTYSSVF